jgi:hypothetical protein
VYPYLSNTRKKGADVNAAGGLYSAGRETKAPHVVTGRGHEGIVRLPLCCNVKSAEGSDFWLWNMGMLYTQYRPQSGLLSRVFQLLKPCLKHRHVAPAIAGRFTERIATREGAQGKYQYKG